MTSKNDETYTLTQIDFCGIRTAAIPEYDHTDVESSEAVNEAEDGAVDAKFGLVFTVIHECEHLWIERRLGQRTGASPKHPGPSPDQGMMAWAPNSYGKTYMFEHLLSTSPRGITELRELFKLCQGLKRGLAGLEPLRPTSRPFTFHGITNDFTTRERR